MILDLVGQRCVIVTLEPARHGFGYRGTITNAYTDVNGDPIAVEMTQHLDDSGERFLVPWVAIARIRYIDPE